MDDNMNKDFDNKGEKDETAFGSSEYYKKLYDDFPEDIAEMLIGTHPLMKKEVSDELTHSIKIKSAKEKNLRAVMDEENEDKSDNIPEEKEEFEKSHGMESASKDPVDEFENENINDYVGDITDFTKGLATVEEPETPNHYEEKSHDDITAEKIARMLGGVEVEAVEEDADDFEEEVPKTRAKNDHRKDQVNKEHRPAKKKKRKPIAEKDLELTNIDKQANLNELFREDNDYYDEKHSSASVARIAIIVAAIVVLAFFIYKVASLSGNVKKLEAEVETYKTMKTEYEELKLEKLDLENKVKELTEQLNGGSTTQPTETSTPETSGSSVPASSSNSSGSSSQSNSSGSSSNVGSKTYTVQSGDTFWGIATKAYGNGSHYDKILKANGLTENDKLKEGMTLTIPAL